MVTEQIEFTERELLMSHEVAEPLFAGGRRCHGGFDDDGVYISPRTRFRAPAIDAWRARHREVFATEIIDVPVESFGEQFPNVSQARYLLGAGVPEPLIATLTRIGKVEGLGANIRLLKPENLQVHFDEDIKGSAIDHLGRGLFEAHGRDEAGFEEEAGHEDMWYAARDIAFDHPAAKVDVEAMLDRLGFGPNRRSGGSAERLLPDDISPNLEAMAMLMVRVLLIEVSAFRTFAWAEEWLSDHDLVAGDGAAADLVSHIRADETPHVAYLATALTEMRDRTWIGESGRKHAGADLVGTLLDTGIAGAQGQGRDEGRAATLREIQRWVEQRQNPEELMAGFHALATPEPEPAG